MERSGIAGVLMSGTLTLLLVAGSTLTVRALAGSTLTVRALGGAAGAAAAAHSPRPAPTIPAALETMGPAVGSIEGVVRLAGDDVAEPRTVVNTTDPEVCGEVQSRADLLVAEPSRGVRNVIVVLGGPSAERLPAAPPEHLVLDNRDCQFVPHVAALSAGSTIEVTSQDPVLHTVHFYGALERNVALPMAGMSVTVTAPEPGMLMVLCDVHGWMQAFVRVGRHGHDAVSDAEGEFRIEDVPAGTYDLEIWHERLGQRTQPVTVQAGLTSEVEIFYTPVNQRKEKDDHSFESMPEIPDVQVFKEYVDATSATSTPTRPSSTPASIPRPRPRPELRVPVEMLFE